MSREAVGTVLSGQATGRDGGEMVAVRGVVAPTDTSTPAPPDPDAEATAFVRFCYRRRAVAWPELYDEMCAVAARGEYHGLGYEELAHRGIGFGLPHLPRLSQLSARVIEEERRRRPVAAVA